MVFCICSIILFCYSSGEAILFSYTSGLSFELLWRGEDWREIEMGRRKELG